jgi:hypothetical protein
VLKIGSRQFSIQKDKNLTHAKEAKKQLKIRVNMTYGDVAPEQAIRLRQIMTRLLQPLEEGVKKRGKEGHFEPVKGQVGSQDDGKAPG